MVGKAYEVCYNLGVQIYSKKSGSRTLFEQEMRRVLVGD